MIESPSPAGNPQSDEAIGALRDSLAGVLSELVRTPSENLPPHGNEMACQTHVAERLRLLGLAPDVYIPAEVAGISAHPEFWPGRDYGGRPNVSAVWKGTGGGRSLILSGHIDTVPADTPVEWRHPPFGAAVEGGRLFGRGAWDMKAGVAMNLTVLRALRGMGARLKGDLIFETVVDEEFGGVNGTLAARLRGYHAEAAVIGEPTSLRICPAQRGGRTLHILLRGEGGILSAERQPGRAVEQLAYVLGKIPEFAETRKRRVAVHPYYADSAEPFAVWVTNIATGRWGWTQPIAVPEICRLEIYWQAMPGETREEVEGEFFRWWNETLDQRRDLFRQRPAVELPMRWLPGCAIAPDAPLVREFSAAAAAALGRRVKVEGMDAPSDMYVFQRCFGIPAIMWGPAGGNAHQADEFVELDSLTEATRVLLKFVCGWCEVNGDA